MKMRFWALLLLATSVFQTTWANCDDSDSCLNVAGCSKVFSDNYIEGRAGYFYFFDKNFREAYPGNGQYGVELNMQFFDMLYGWVQSGYYYTSGKLGTIKTDLTIVPNSFGLKFIYNRYMFQPYVGVGGLVSYVNQHMDSDILIKSNSKWCGGGHFKFGLLWKCTNSFLVDLFVDCYAQHLTMDENKYRFVYYDQINVSGLSAGGGLAYRF